MSDANAKDFDQITQLADRGGAVPTLHFLEQRFRDKNDYFKLFEVLKMRCRYALGLPLTYGTQPDELAEDMQRKLEDGLLAACREVGTLLVRNGQLAEGWMYLQPVGDRELSQALIQSFPVDEENIETVIEIAISQGAAPAYGYQLLLEHYGTCNAITTFDTQAMRFDKRTQQAMAGLLVGQLYGELMVNLRAIIEREGKTAANDITLTELLEAHRWLVEGGAFHIDTTHLASVMRIARIMDEPEDLKKAVELADYGRHLPTDFQYSSPPPFEETYPDHQYFFRGLIGENVEAAIAHFENKCQTIDANQHGAVAYETLVDFLVRVRRRTRAIEVLTQQVIGKFEPLGIAPGVFEIARSAEELKIAKDFFLEQGDLLGYAVSVLKVEN